jgi:hypothetical protein
VLWCLAAVDWQAYALAHQWVERPIAKLETYAARMRDFVDELREHRPAASLTHGFRPALAGSAQRAVDVARSLGIQRRPPSQVEILDESAATSVYRLRWPGDVLEGLVVKQYRGDATPLERTIYERVLPRISLPSLEYYGSVVDEEGSCWLALEDAGDDEPVLDATARYELTKSVAALHLSGAELDRTVLPERGPRHFAVRLRDTRSQLTERIESGDGGAEGRTILMRAVDRCDALASRWAEIERACQHLPATIVHGDIAEENLRLVRRQSGVRVALLDWEKAGWSAPVVDLPRLEVADYRTLVADWLPISAVDSDEIVRIGRIFRVLVHRWAAKPLRKVDRYERRLASLMSEAGWEDAA